MSNKSDIKPILTKKYSSEAIKRCTESILKNLPLVENFDFEDKEENKIGEIKDEI